MSTARTGLLTARAPLALPFPAVVLFAPDATAAPAAVPGPPAAVMTGGRPPWFPLRAAALRPSRVASRMFSQDHGSHVYGTAYQYIGNILRPQASTETDSISP